MGIANVTRRRSRRKPRTIGGLGDDLSYMYEYGEQDQDNIGWIRTEDPNIVKTEVPNGTPLDPRVIGVAVNHPRQGTTTWTAPTTEAIAQGKLQAAVDTIAATGAQLTAAGESILTTFGTVAANLPLILAALAAVYLLFKWESAK